jgi:hypothetical protein
MPLKLPIWIYWEGPQPEWIELCRRTIFAHASDVSALTPDSFDELRDRDRDIDLSGLCAAHRADFIRSFLLARYGGLWIDSDCLLMKNLEPWVGALGQHDFIGYKERGEPYVTNSFIGARPGSLIAAEFYRRNCAILRSQVSLEWTTIGAMSLTETVRDLRRPWLQLGYDLIQPICWSRPELFFIRRSETAHEAELNRRSVCYMLSKTSIDAFVCANPDRSLLEEDTFFTFLYRHAMGAEKTEARRKPLVYPSSWNHIPFCAALLKEINPFTVIDTAINFGRWGILVRDVCDHSSGRIHRENWQVWIEGIAASPTEIEEYHDHFYNWIHVGDAATILSTINRRFELAFVTVASALPTAIELCDYVVAVIANIAGLELTLNPIRQEIFDDGNGRYDVLLFSKDDPKSLTHSNTEYTDFSA